MRSLAYHTHIGRYLLESRHPVYQLIALLPLLVLYEIAAIVINFDMPFQVRNGADIYLKLALRALGIRSVFGFVLWAVLLVSLLIIVSLRRYGRPLKAHYFAALLVESVVWSVVIGIASARITGIVIGSNPFLAAGPTGSLAERLMVGIGAGVYEEIVFRALMISILLSLFRLFRFRESRASVFAVAVSAILFSAFHHVGEFGEIFRMHVFMYRVVAGVILSAIYTTRGLGVSAWSHAIYDVLIAVDLM